MTHRPHWASHSLRQRDGQASLRESIQPLCLRHGIQIECRQPLCLGQIAPAAQRQAAERLRQARPGVDVVWSPFTRAPRRVFMVRGFLTDASSKPRRSRRHLSIR